MIHCTHTSGRELSYQFPVNTPRAALRQSAPGCLARLSAIQRTHKVVFIPGVNDVPRIPIYDLKSLIWNSNGIVYNDEYRHQETR